jgi:arylsulfatase
MKNRSWTLTADVEVDGPEAEGVILASGGGSAGLVLYLDQGVPVFDYNYFDTHTVVKGISPLPEGAATIEVDFAYAGAEGEVGKGATVTLKVNGEQVAEGTLEATVPGRFGVDTFGIGQDTGQPVVFEYEPPFPFTGTIDQVTLKVSG